MKKNQGIFKSNYSYYCKDANFNDVINYINSIFNESTIEKYNPTIKINDYKFSQNYKSTHELVCSLNISITDSYINNSIQQTQLLFNFFSKDYHNYNNVKSKILDKYIEYILNQYVQLKKPTFSHKLYNFIPYINYYLMNNNLYFINIVDQYKNLLFELINGEDFKQKYDDGCISLVQTDIDNLFNKSTLVFKDKSTLEVQDILNKLINKAIIKRILT